MFNIYLRPDAETLAQLNRLETIAILLDERTNEMALDLTRIKQEVEETKSVAASAIALINSISETLRNLPIQNEADQATVNALADELDAQNNTLAAAVVANTPSAPEPAPEA